MCVHPAYRCVASNCIPSSKVGTTVSSRYARAGSEFNAEICARGGVSIAGRSAVTAGGGAAGGVLCRLCDSLKVL